MQLNQVSAQLYTCRDSLQDSAGVAKTLTRLRKIGYTTVQASGIAAAVSTGELCRILSDTGMVCTSTHEDSHVILDNPEKVVERLNLLGCKITAYAFPAGIDFSSRAAVDAMIARLDHSGQVLAKAGQTLCYHNHNIEFRKLDGKVILDLIYEKSSKALQAEIDTYWVQFGGGDNLVWCKKLAGRLPILHLKDFQTTPDNQPAFAEIGTGVLDFKSIIAAAEAAGCKLFCVEQDTCPGDPVDSLEKSFHYIEENLVS